MLQLTHKTCPHCFNPQVVIEYNYAIEEVYECCDVCGCFKHVALLNKEDCELNRVKPKYKSQKANSSFVVKIFERDSDSYLTACVEKKDVKGVVAQFKASPQIRMFAITFKDGLGNYQTELYYNK